MAESRDTYLDYIMTKDMTIDVRKDEHSSQSIYADNSRIGEVDHDNVVFLVNRKYELVVLKALQSIAPGPYEFVY